MKISLVDIEIIGLKEIAKKYFEKNTSETCSLPFASLKPAGWA